MSILVVEDDAMIRAALARVLAKTGHTVLEAADGAKALECLRTVQPRPSLILLDLVMPVMDGVQFRRAQLADPDLACIPVVVLTAASQTEAETAELRAVAVLIKPIEMVDLLGAVAQVIGPHTAG
ncbi:MAG TPA: response regulator [Roseiflexaceae bacterium]|nr:response regulator [Roseiflexaceae bacterium]